METHTTTQEINAEEPAPVPNDNIPIWELVIEDMRQRNQEGIRKYGTPLQPFNGRRAMVDAYQESLDMTVYLRQALAEKEIANDIRTEMNMILKLTDLILYRNDGKWRLADDGDGSRMLCSLSELDYAGVFHLRNHLMQRVRVFMSSATSHFVDPRDLLEDLVDARKRLEDMVRNVLDAGNSEEQP